MAFGYNVINRRSMPLNSKGNFIHVYLLGDSQEQYDKQNSIYHMMLVIKIPWKMEQFRKADCGSSRLRVGEERGDKWIWVYREWRMFATSHRIIQQLISLISQGKPIRARDSVWRIKPNAKRVGIIALWLKWPFLAVDFSCSLSPFCYKLEI